MSILLGSVAAYTVIFVLLIAAIGHLASPATLSRAVAAHGLFPWPVAIPAAVTAPTSAPSTRASVAPPTPVTSPAA